MTIEAAEEMLAEIVALAKARKGPEAHVIEDELFGMVLGAIAAGEAEDPAALARVAMRSREVDFDRWYE